MESIIRNSSRNGFLPRSRSLEIIDDSSKNKESPMDYDSVEEDDENDNFRSVLRDLFSGSEEGNRQRCSIEEAARGLRRTSAAYKRKLWEEAEREKRSREKGRTVSNYYRLKTGTLGALVTLEGKKLNAQAEKCHTLSYLEGSIANARRVNQELKSAVAYQMEGRSKGCRIWVDPPDLSPLRAEVSALRARVLQLGKEVDAFHYLTLGRSSNKEEEGTEAAVTGGGALPPPPRTCRQAPPPPRPPVVHQARPSPSCWSFFRRIVPRRRSHRIPPLPTSAFNRRT